MIVKLKDFSDRIKVKKQTQFMNFLKSILIIDEKEKEFTEEEINQSILIEHKN